LFVTNQIEGKVEKLGNLNDLRYWNYHKGTKFFLKDRRVKDTKMVYLNHFRDRNKFGYFSLVYMLVPLLSDDFAFHRNHLCDLLTRQTCPFSLCLCVKKMCVIFLYCLKWFKKSGSILKVFPAIICLHPRNRIFVQIQYCP